MRLLFCLVIEIFRPIEWAWNYCGQARNNSMKGYTFRFATSWLCSFSLAVTALSCGKSDSGSGPTTQAMHSGEDVQLNGAGSSFAFPILTQWFKDYRALHPNVVVEYAGTGSGAGITQFTAGNVDFGASDAAMSDDEISKVNGGVVMLPVTAGAIVIAYNLQGVVDLKLSRSTVAQIFVGKITKWSDPAIASNNPGVTLPDSPINVVPAAQQRYNLRVYVPPGRQQHRLDTW